MHGTTAIALGAALLGAVVRAQGRVFWGPTRGRQLLHELGRIVGAAIFLSGFGYVLCGLLWPGA